MHRWWSWTKSEPYRIFFPLALLGACLGVLIWPLFYWHVWPIFPNVSHPRLMIGSMMSAFILGFLGTAFHRLSNSKPWSIPEWLLLLGLWTSTSTLYAMGKIAVGDACFCGLLIVLLLGAITRLLRRTPILPPPGFVLVMVSILATIAATAYLATHSTSTSPSFHLAQLQLYQGFVLLPLMGIGPYLLPRFFQKSSTHSLPDSPKISPEWSLLANKSLVFGALVFASFGLEVAGHQAPAYSLRALTCLAWFLLETPIFQPNPSPNTPANSTRIAMAFIGIGLLAAGFGGAARIGWLHLFFVSGIGLITLTAATRVVLGHANRHDRLTGRLRWLRWLIGLTILAASTRTTCDLIPTVKISHQIYAAWTWVAVTVLWLLAIGKYLGIKTTPINRCPKRLPLLNLTKNSLAASPPTPPTADTDA